MVNKMSLGFSSSKINLNKGPKYGMHAKECIHIFIRSESVWESKGINPNALKVIPTLQVGIVKESQMFIRQFARLKSFKSNDLQFVKKISLQATYHVMRSHCQKPI